MTAHAWCHRDMLAVNGLVWHRDFMAREDPKFMLRLPGDMRDRIAEAAKANNRSMNAEIVARLEATFSGGISAAGALMGLAVRALSLLEPNKLESVLKAAKEMAPERFDEEMGKSFENSRQREPRE